LVEDLEKLLPEREKKAKEKLKNLEEKDKHPKKKGQKNKYKKIGEKDVDDFSSDDDSSSLDFSIDDEDAENIQEDLDELGLLFPDLQPSGGDVNMLLSNLDDPNFGTSDDPEKNKKERRNRKKKSPNDQIEDDYFPLFGPAEGSIRLKPSEWNRPELDISQFYPEEEMSYNPFSTKKNVDLDSYPLMLFRCQNLKTLTNCQITN